MAPAAVARHFKKSMPNESIFELGREKENEWETMSMCSEAESVASVANSIVTVAQETIKPIQQDFLILDTRDQDAYETLHIVDAIHCPAQLVSSARNAAALYPYRRTPGKFLIVYAWDERPGIMAAQQIAESGFENVFLINGGLEEFARMFPNLVERG